MARGGGIPPDGDANIRCDSYVLRPRVWLPSRKLVVGERHLRVTSVSHSSDPVGGTAPVRDDGPPVFSSSWHHVVEGHRQVKLA